MLIIRCTFIPAFKIILCVPVLVSHNHSGLPYCRGKKKKNYNQKLHVTYKIGIGIGFDTNLFFIGNDDYVEHKSAWNGVFFNQFSFLIVHCKNLICKSDSKVVSKVYIYKRKSSLCLDFFNEINCTKSCISVSRCLLITFSSVERTAVWSLYGQNKKTLL